MIIEALVGMIREYLAGCATCDRCGVPLPNGGGLCAECHVDVFDRPLTAAATPANPPPFDPMIRPRAADHAYREAMRKNYEARRVSYLNGAQYTLDCNQIYEPGRPMMRSWVRQNPTAPPDLPFSMGCYAGNKSVASPKQDKPTAILHPLIAFCQDIEAAAGVISGQIWEIMADTRFSAVITSTGDLVAESLSPLQAAHVVATQPKVAIALCAKLREADALILALFIRLPVAERAEIAPRLHAFAELEL